MNSATLPNNFASIMMMQSKPECPIVNLSSAMSGGPIASSTQLLAMQKPKRPLSAFNLFYRFKRQKVLAAIAESSNISELNITRLIQCPPGLEHLDDDATSSLNAQQTSETINAYRRANIVRDLEGHRNARDTKARAHRKDKGLSGAISFVQMGKLMNSSWKACDDVARAVFNELAEEGREIYRILVKEYQDRNKALGLTGKKNKNKNKKLGGASVGATATKKRTRDDQVVVHHQPSLYTKEETTEEVAARQVSNGSCGDGEMTDHDLAETMLKLRASTPPSKKRKTLSGPIKKRMTAAPTLNDLLSAKKKVGEASTAQSQVMMGDNNGAVSSVLPRRTSPELLAAMQQQRQLVAVQQQIAQREAAMHQQQQQMANFPMTSSAFQRHEQEMVYRIRALENQLAEERLQARIQHLQDQMAQRKREAQMRSMIAATMNSQAAQGNPQGVVGGGGGLWSHISASMVQPHPSLPSVQVQQERHQQQARMLLDQKKMSGQNATTFRPPAPPLIHNDGGVPRAA